MVASPLDINSLLQRGRLRYEDSAFLDTTPFPDGKGKEEGASPPQKETNPASLRSAAPSKGRGSRGHSLLPMEGGAPKGRRLDGGSGMKKSGDMRFKQAIYGSRRAPIFLKSDARKQHGKHKSIKAPYP